MKRLVISLMWISLPLVAFADAVEIDGIYYELISKAKEAIVTKNPNNYSGNVDIPSTIAYNDVEYNVTSIGEYAFSEDNDLTSVTIPNSVTSIGSYAFKNCSSLTTATIPNSVTTLGIFIFSNCSELTSVVLGDGLTSVGAGAFHSCRKLTSVIIPERVTSISYEAFEGCSSLTSISLPNCLTYIGESAFAGCSSLTSITIPHGVTGIGYQAFDRCYGLTKVNITDLAAWCGISFNWGSNGDGPAIYQRNFTCNPLFYAQHLFLNDVEITELEIPDEVTSIRDAVFMNCSHLTSVTFPNNYNIWVGDYAFYECIGLTSVNISNLAAWCSVNFEGGTSTPLYYAKKLYLNGNELKDLIIPDDATSIRQYSFHGCAGLTSVTIPGSVRTIDANAFNGCSGLTSVTLNEGLTSIGKLAFYNCSSLTSIAFPNSVLSIEELAFKNCSSLTSLTLPKSLYTIENSVFSNCSSLTYVNIPDGVANIGFGSFYNCSKLAIIIIGSGVKKIESNAFASCPEITDVYCYAEKVPQESYNAFTDSYIDYATLHVPEGSIEAYKKVSPWKNFRNIVPLDGQSIETLEYTSPTAPIYIYSPDGNLIGTTNSQDEAASIVSSLSRGSVAIVKKGGKSEKVLNR